MIPSLFERHVRWPHLGLLLVLAVALLPGCKKDEKKAEERPPVEVTVMKIVPRDTPVSFEYVGQTQSTRQVQIVARVNGFLDKQARVHRRVSTTAMPGHARKAQSALERRAGERAPRRSVVMIGALLLRLNLLARVVYGSC